MPIERSPTRGWAPSSLISESELVLVAPLFWRPLVNLSLSGGRKKGNLNAPCSRTLPLPSPQLTTTNNIKWAAAQGWATQKRDPSASRPSVYGKIKNERENISPPGAVYLFPQRRPAAARPDPLIWIDPLAFSPSLSLKDLNHFQFKWPSRQKERESREEPNQNKPKRVRWKAEIWFLALKKTFVSHHRWWNFPQFHFIWRIMFYLCIW